MNPEKPIVENALPEMADDGHTGHNMPAVISEPVPEIVLLYCAKCRKELPYSKSDVIQCDHCKSYNGIEPDGRVGIIDLEKIKQESKDKKPKADKKVGLLNALGVSGRNIAIAVGLVGVVAILFWYIHKKYFKK